MTNVHLKGFTINVAKAKSKRTIKSKSVRVSRLCKAVVALDEGIYVAKINLQNDENHPDTLVIPFTEESYNLKGKEYVFSKNKDKYNHYTCYIRTKYNATNFPGLTTQYEVLKPNIVVGGYIVRINGKHYFEYTQFVSTNETCPEYMPLITDDNKPVFYKGK